MRIRLVKTSASIVIGQKVKIKSIVPKGASVSCQFADKKIASVSAKGTYTGDVKKKVIINRTNISLHLKFQT